VILVSSGISPQTAVDVFRAGLDDWHLVAMHVAI
jgi:hypothetical protein